MTEHVPVGFFGRQRSSDEADASPGSTTPLSLTDSRHTLTLPTQCPHLGSLATVHSYENTSDSPLEVIMRLRASSTPYALTCSFYNTETGELLERSKGQVKSKQAASEAYDDVLAEGGRRAVVVERDEQSPDDEGLVVVSIGSVGSKVRVEIEMVSVVQMQIELDEDEDDDDDEEEAAGEAKRSRQLVFSHRIPAIQVGGTDVEKNVSVSVLIESGPADPPRKPWWCAEVESVTHPFAFETRDEDGMLDFRTLEEAKISPTQDCVIQLKICNFPLVSALCAPLKNDEQRAWKSGSSFDHAVLTSVIPHFKLTDDEYMCEFDLIVDCSGSMRGNRMSFAKQALTLFLQSLDVTRPIKYNIIRFGTDFQRLFPSAVRLADDENLARARTYVERMDANLGGTNMLKPLQWLFGKGGRQPEDVRLEQLEKSVRQNVCTYKVTQKEFTTQHWFYCNTCGLTGNTGCCASCAAVCHAGHDTTESPKSPSRFYCDCGAGRPECKLKEKEYVDVQEAEEATDGQFVRQVFLFTDGEDSHAAEICRLAREEANQHGVRVFSFGIGSGCRETFIRDVAEASRGSPCFIKDNATMKAKIMKQLLLAQRVAIDDCRVGVPNVTAVEKIDRNPKSQKVMLFNGEVHHQSFWVKSETIPSEIEFTYVYKNEQQSLSAKPVVVPESRIGPEDEEEEEGGGSTTTVADLVRVVVAKETARVKQYAANLTTIGTAFGLVTKNTSLLLVSDKQEEVILSEMKSVTVTAPTRRGPTKALFGKSSGAASWGGTRGLKQQQQQQQTAAFTGTHGQDWARAAQPAATKAFSGTHGQDWATSIPCAAPAPAPAAPPPPPMGMPMPTTTSGSIGGFLSSLGALGGASAGMGGGSRGGGGGGPPGGLGLARLAKEGQSSRGKDRDRARRSPSRPSRGRGRGGSRPRPKAAARPSAGGRGRRPMEAARRVRREQTKKKSRPPVELKPSAKRSKGSVPMPPCEPDECLCEPEPEPECLPMAPSAASVMMPMMDMMDDAFAGEMISESPMIEEESRMMMKCEEEEEDEGEESCDDDDDENAGAGEAIVMIPKISPSSKVSPANLSSLLLKSDMLGLFQPDSAICDLIGIPMSACDEKIPAYVKDNPSGKKWWITAVVVAVMMTLYVGKRSEWRLIVQKSKRTLKKEMRAASVSGNILRDAQAFVMSFC